MVKHLILLGTFCLLSTAAFATEADFQKRMARGVVALESGDTSAAREEFKAALTEHPDDPEANLYLAITLNRAGDTAAEAALKNALRLYPGNPRANLELGTYYFNQKMYDEAGDYFENLLTLKPEPDLQTAAETYLTGIRSRSGGKRWEITLLGGMQYDSNVPLAAADVQLPTGIDRRGDWRGILNLGLGGTLLRNATQELTGRYSLYQTLHLHLDSFNLTQNLFELTYKRTLSPQLSLRLTGNVESTLLGGDQFVSGFTIAPALTYTYREGMNSGIEYRLRDSSFKNSATFPGNTERNGLTHTIILNHRQQLGDTMNLRLAYTFERETTDVSTWSATGHQGSTGLAVTLPHALLLDLSLELGGKTYDAPQAGATSKRNDFTIAGGGSLTWQALNYVSASIGYHYTSNSSNTTGYDYTRGITSLMFQGRY